MLVLINAALFLWATGFVHSDTAVPREPVALAGMRLLEETRPAGVTEPSDAAPCYRIGPFEGENPAVLASQKLDSLNVPYRRVVVEEREIRAYRVFSGPHTDPAGLQAQRTALAAADVTDFYVIHDSAGDLISLGLFTQQASAERLKEKLTGQNIDASVRPEDRLVGPIYWLELTDQTANQRAAAELEETSWGDARAQLRPFTCN